MVNGYAQEYSPSNIAKLTQSYGALLDPQAEDARRRLAQSLAGTPGMYGSARAGGLGQIGAAQLAQIGQYGQRLSEAGIEAGRGERLTAEERAYTESPASQFSRQLAQQGSQFGLTLAEQIAQRQQQGGQFQQSYGLQSQQVADALANSLLNRQWYPTQYTGMTPTGEKSQALKEWETSQTGSYGGQKTLATQLAEAALTGQYGGQNTQQYLQSLLPYVQAGNLPSSVLGSSYAGFQTNQQLDPSYQFFQKPSMSGYNPYYLSLLAQTNPDKLKEILNNY